MDSDMRKLRVLGREAAFDGNPGKAASILMLCKGAEFDSLQEGGNP